MSTKIRPAPRGLGQRGRRYWREILGTFALSDSELHLLMEVCRTLDTLDQLAESVAKDGATVAGSAGQVVVNPCITEARGQRVVLHRLISALNLPDEDGAAIPTAHSQRGKAANAVRWRGHVKDGA